VEGIVFEGVDGTVEVTVTTAPAAASSGGSAAPAGVTSTLTSALTPDVGAADAKPQAAGVGA